MSHFPYLSKSLKDRQALVGLKLTVHGLNGVKPPLQPSNFLSYLTLGALGMLYTYKP